jgi:hypothetical protein
VSLKECISTAPPHAASGYQTKALPCPPQRKAQARDRRTFVPRSCHRTALTQSWPEVVAVSCCWGPQCFCPRLRSQRVGSNPLPERPVTPRNGCQTRRLSPRAFALQRKDYARRCCRLVHSFSASLVHSFSASLVHSFSASLGYSPPSADRRERLQPSVQMTSPCAPQCT